jgi:Tfp pilus assembly pilus retraction ATPase PilT
MAEPKHLQTPEQLAAVLNQLVEHKVSDIYVCAGKTVHVRTNGEVRPTSIIAPGEADLVAFLNQAGNTAIKGAITCAETCPEGSVDGAITCEGRRYRFNFYRVLDGQTLRQTARISLRPLSDHIPAPEEI